MASVNGDFKIEYLKVIEGYQLADTFIKYRGYVDGEEPRWISDSYYFLRDPICLGKGSSLLLGQQTCSCFQIGTIKDISLRNFNAFLQTKKVMGSGIPNSITYYYSQIMVETLAKLPPTSV